jgi:hypothetical protein
LEHEPDRTEPGRQDQLVALAWVRGELGFAEVARAYGLPETASSSEIFRRLSAALKAYVRQREGTPPTAGGNRKK